MRLLAAQNPMRPCLNRFAYSSRTPQGSRFALPYIDLESLPPKETTIIGIDPLPLLQPGQRTIYVVHPFMRVDDVRPMGEILKQGKKHLVVLYVSAIRFADGTQWEMRPPAG